MRPTPGTPGIVARSARRRAAAVWAWRGVALRWRLVAGVVKGVEVGQAGPTATDGKKKRDSHEWGGHVARQGTKGGVAQCRAGRRV